MNISFDNNIPIYIQLMDFLEVYIISGEIKPGDKLPSVRDLANRFKVNPNTMQKALAELENNKLIYAESTSGRYVTSDKSIIKKIRDEHITNYIDSYLDSMNNIGVSKEDAINYLSERKEQ